MELQTSAGGAGKRQASEAISPLRLSPNFNENTWNLFHRQVGQILRVFSTYYPLFYIQVDFQVHIMDLYIHFVSSARMGQNHDVYITFYNSYISELLRKQIFDIDKFLS